MDIYLDIESTGKNPYQAEMIEAYLIREDGIDYHFKSQVSKWSLEAEEIHKIPKAEMMTYPPKKEAFDNLISWLPDKFNLIIYANYRTELGYLLYDEVLLKMSLLDHLSLDRVEHLPFEISSFSCHALAKECAKSGLFDPYRNPETNRQSFTQNNVYYALFDELPSVSHRAKSDTLTLRKIHKKLLELKESGESISQKSQLSLL